MKRLKLTIVAIFAFALAATAQSIESLRQQMIANENEIRATNELLSKTKNEQTAGNRRLQLVRNNISSRKKIVANLDRQIIIIEREASAKNSTVNALSAEMTELKSEYSAMILASYKNYRLNNYLAFIFASKDFNDIARRIQYMKLYTLSRERKAAEIDSLSSKLSGEIVELNVKKTELDNTVKARNEELSKLAKEEGEYRRIVASLSSQATKLTRDIAAKKTANANLQRQIEKIIAEEAKKAQSAKRTTAQRQELIQLSGRFDQNIGKFPYPAAGVIIERFGEHPHPTQPNVKVKSNGINIATDKGATVRSIFEGVVSSVLMIPGYRNTVMIQHGSYYTVYANLESVGVKSGDKIATNQVLGRVSSDSDEESHMLHFEIWKEGQGTPVKLNPEVWLR